MEEMLGDGGSGMLVEPNRVRQLADAINRLMANPPLVRSIAVRARKRLLDSYSAGAIGPHQEALYREAAALRHVA
jgi:glycosyltransferase involved in cell wall biosynthesis